MTINEVFEEAPLDHPGAHRYSTVSAHNTSEGRIAYQRCACGLWRIQRYNRAGGSVLEACVDQREQMVPVTPLLSVPVYASIEARGMVNSRIGHAQPAGSLVPFTEDLLPAVQPWFTDPRFATGSAARTGRLANCG